MAQAAFRIGETGGRRNGNERPELSGQGRRARRWILIVQDIINSFLAADIGLPLFSSLLTGFLIGLEREVRAKDAGLRTHTLVCFASTLVMLAATRQGEWTIEFIEAGRIVADPTRMAHGVLTGIGFLCAGVIFREGATVHGLTTAASLWVTASLGLLYGAGMYWLAVTGAVSTMAVLILFRLFYKVLPERIAAAVDVRCAHGAEFDAAALRALLERCGARTGSIAQRREQRGGGLELATTAMMRNRADYENLANVLARAPGVEGFKLLPLDDIAHHAAAWG
jgi:putative Mg2+ transporter-C (MgtC) family protein